MSGSSDVTIAACRDVAMRTTDASTMLDVSAVAHSNLTSRASDSSRGSFTQPRSTCDNRACGPPRHACASTPAGTMGGDPAAQRRVMQRPHRPVVAFAGDERAGVVDDHAL